MLSPADAAEPQLPPELSPKIIATGEETVESGPITEERHTISLNRLRRAPPADAEALYVEAAQALEDNEADKAARKLRKALRAHPEYVEAHNNLGFVYWQQGRLQDAIRHFKTAVSLDPAWNTSLVNLALAFYALGNFDEALNTINRAVELDPQSARAHYAAGLILLKSDTPTGAALEHLREASDDFPKAQLMAAYVMLRLNRPEQAQETLYGYIMNTPLR
jgi:tetratricopeptide (TPR) repeat protein